MFEQHLSDVPRDPVQLARRLAGRAFVSLIWGQNGTLAYLACDPVEHSQALDPEPGLALTPRSSGQEVPRWVGLLPYEARRELERAGYGSARVAPHVSEPHWLRYAAVARIATDSVRLLGESTAAVSALADRLRGPARHDEPVTLSRLGAFEPPERHRARIRRALEHIRAGDLYQVNLARRFELQVRGAAWDVLARLLERGRPPFAAALSWQGLDVISLSPELFLSTNTYGSIFTSPIKGTRPRGASPARDAELARELDTDPKERAELTMVLDVERNDLARLALPGTVLHRMATLRAELRPGVTRSELLQRMLPSGSVTGAPKVRAMDLIAELEAERRGLYTGAFGYLAYDGSLQLAMAIRTLTVREGQGHYWAGGGIVADSDPEREVEETLWKAEALLGLVGSSKN